MPCCTVTIIPFVNQTETTIPYTGAKPTVSVSYLVDGVWQALGYVTAQVLDSLNVYIKHGGPSTGVVRLTQ
jgi:hypothetical protein